MFVGQAGVQKSLSAKENSRIVLNAESDSSVSSCHNEKAARRRLSGLITSKAVKCVPP